MSSSSEYFCRADPQDELGRCCPCEGKVRDCDCRFVASCAVTAAVGPEGALALPSRCGRSEPARLWMTTRELELVGPGERAAEVRMWDDGVRTAVFPRPAHRDLDHVGSWARFETPSLPSYAAGLWRRHGRHPRLRTGLHASERLGATPEETAQSLRLGAFDASNQRWESGLRLDRTGTSGSALGLRADRIRFTDEERGSGPVEAPSAALPTDERLQRVIDALVAFGLLTDDE